VPVDLVLNFEHFYECRPNFADVLARHESNVTQISRCRIKQFRRFSQFSIDTSQHRTCVLLHGILIRRQSARILLCVGDAVKRGKLSMLLNSWTGETATVYKKQQVVHILCVPSFWTEGLMFQDRGLTREQT
jgi:hypothetical protein